MLCKKTVLKIFAKVTGKHVLLESFLIRFQASDCNFIENQNTTPVSSCEFCGTFKNTYFIEHLWTTASVILVLFVSVIEFEGKVKFIYIFPFYLVHCSITLVQKSGCLFQLILIIEIYLQLVYAF